MVLRSACWSVLLLLCAPGAQAQLYKWVGSDGKVVYGDIPPPSSAARVELKTGSGAAAAAPASLPFELAQAAKNHPVTLYTFPNCAPCEEGRKLLMERGVPFSEKTITTSEDSAEFKKRNPDGRFPFLTIGRKSERGFESGAWNTALTAGGYPTSSKLPRSYRNPPAEPLAAVAAVPTKPLTRPVEQAADKSRTEQKSRPGIPSQTAAGSAPPGFRF